MAGEGVRLTVLRSEADDLTVRAVGFPDEVEGPVERGRRLGTVQVLDGTEVVAEVPLEAASTVPEAGLGQKVKDYFTRPLVILLLLAVLASSVVVARLIRRRDSRGRGRASEGEPETA